MNFQNVAIKCDTWEQMVNLADLAHKQGFTSFMFTEQYFNQGMNYFVAFDHEYTNSYDTEGYIETTYTQFINQSDTPSVYGC